MLASQEHHISQGLLFCKGLLESSQNTDKVFETADMLLPSIVSLQQLLSVGSVGILHKGEKLSENGEEMERA